MHHQTAVFLKNHSGAKFWGVLPLNPLWGKAVGKLVGPMSLASVRIAAQFLQLSVFVVAARALTVAEFGIFSLVFAIVTGFSVIAEGGLREYTICCDDRNTVRHINGLSLITGAGLAVLMLIGGSLFWYFGLDAAFTSTAVILSLWIFLRPTTVVQTGILTRDGKLSAVSLIQIISEIVSFVVSVAALFGGLGVLALALGKIALQLTELVGSLLATRWYRVAQPNAVEYKPIIAFSRRILVVRLMQFFQMNFSTLIIGTFLAPVAVGLYRAAVRIAGAVQETIREPARFVGWSMLRAARERDGNVDGAQLPAAALRYSQTLFLVAGPVLLTLGLMAEPLISALLGTKWLSAAPIILPLALAACARLLASVIEPLLSIQGRPEIVQRNAAILTAISVVLLCGALPFGVQWVAWAELLAALVSVPLTLYTLQKDGKIPVRALLGSLCPVLLGWIVCAALIIWGQTVGPVSTAPFLVQISVVGALATVGYLMVVAAIFKLFARNGISPLPWRFT